MQKRGQITVFVIIFLVVLITLALFYFTKSNLFDISVKGINIQKKLEVELKKGVKFHDGTDLQARDVLYSFNYARKSKESFLYQLTSSIEDIQILSENRLKFRLKKYDDFFRYALMYVPIVKDKNFDSGTIIIHNGSGPFKFKNYSPKDHVLTL